MIPLFTPDPNAVKTVFLSALFLLLSIPPPCQCLHAQEQSEILLQELNAQQERLEALDRDLKKNRRSAVKVEKNKIAVLAQIQELDARIQEQWQRLDKVKKEWSAAEFELENTRRDIRQYRQKLSNLKTYIESRLIAMREMGMIGLLNVLFKATSIPDLLSREQYLRLILEHDSRKRREYASQLAKLSEKEELLEKQSQAIRKLSQDVEQQALLLETRKQEKDAFLRELEHQGEKYAAMIRELQQARAELQKLIEDLNQELYLTQGPSAEELNSFAAQKGHLNPPVIKRPLPVYNTRNRKRVRGAVFDVPWGTEIRAVFDGKVIYCGSLAGYGKVMIIDHGNHYLTLTAQGASFFKNPGDEVVEGDVIGISGGGAWIKEGIYFELRHGKKTENPLKWFDLRGIR